MRTRFGLTTGLALAALTLTPVAGLEQSGGVLEQPEVIACGDVAALRTAILTANARAGDDTISLAAGCTYTIADQYSDQEALPPFQKKSIILEGNGATLRRASGDLRFRLINVAATGRLIIRNLTISNGWARTAVGIGAIRVDGDLFVTGSRVSGNQAGGVFVTSNGQASFVDSSISDNTQAGFFGAGINNAGLLYLENATVSGNRIPALLGEVSGGGGLHNSGTAIVFKSFVTGNRARGGAGINNGGDLLVLQSAISGNDTDTLVPSQNTGGGSGILSGGTLEVVNSTVAGNRSFWPGSAVQLTGGTAWFLHASIAHNFTTTGTTTPGVAGGILNLDDRATVELKNTIIASNSPSNCTGALTDAGYVLTWGNITGCPATFLVGDPRLSGFFWLVPGVGSAALDRIPPSEPSTVGPEAPCSSLDQRGMPRPGGPACDIGAYENQAPSTPGAISASAPVNQGEFGLSWEAAEDPDDDPISYRLESRAANEPAWTTVGNTSAPQFAFGGSGAEREGRLHYRAGASDGRLPSPDFGLSGEIVVDRTPPRPPTPAADRVPEYVDGDAAWFADTVTVSFAAAGDPPLADGSPGSGIVFTTGPQSFATTGPHTATGGSTDAAGNRSPDVTHEVHVDADPPNVTFGSCPAEVLLGAKASIEWAATDVGSGLAGPASGKIDLPTSPIGSYVAAHSVSDNVGHSSTLSCAYDVVWNFQGFRAPLRSHPSFTTIAAGSVVNVAFSLGGDQGLDVFAPGYPASAPIVCSSVDVSDAGDPTVSLGPLAFGSSSGYTYRWITAKEWSGTCRQLIVKLRDGTFRRANLAFR